eukprot:Skav226915  [mRNA]  locus=scaffold1147:35131:36597:+ [translate_table: standard]
MILRSSSAAFAKFLRTLSNASPSVDEGTALRTWPMPPPYPRWFFSGGEKVNYRRMCAEKSMNMIITALSWLKLGKPSVAPAAMSLSSTLNSRQRRVVRRLERLSSDLVTVGDIGSSAMGRTAAKVESLSFLLHDLEKTARSLVPSYEHREPAQGSRRECSKVSHERGHPGTLAGLLKQGTIAVAKCVEPSRLSFPAEAPMFDPTELYDEPHKTVYQDPISLAISPEESNLEPPRVRVHASKQQALELMSFLDRHNRLRLVPEEKVRVQHTCGAFSLVKDAEKDRLILDARPPNQLEDTLRSWSKTLGAISTVLHIELLPGHNLLMSGTDLRDYYYCFRVSKARAVRNTFNFPMTPSDAQQFNCFHDGLWQHSTIYPCLNTMAMGDCQSVELGQKAHVRLGIVAGAMSPSEMLCVHGRAPRGLLSCGIIIDDSLFLEQVPQDLPRELFCETEGVLRLRKMKEEYTQRELTAHPAKTFEGLLEAEFWGGP